MHSPLLYACITSCTNVSLQHLNEGLNITYYSCHYIALNIGNKITFESGESFAEINRTIHRIASAHLNTHIAMNEYTQTHTKNVNASAQNIINRHDKTVISRRFGPPEPCDKPRIFSYVLSVTLIIAVFFFSCVFLVSLYVSSLPLYVLYSLVFLE